MSFSVLAVLFVGSCVVLQTAAQESYQCTPGFCSRATGYDRAGVIGCKYWCYLDTDPRDGFLTCDELDTAYRSWKGATAECDQNCYVTAHSQIIPEACQNELINAYSMYSALDGDGSTISSEDVQLGCAQIKLFQAPPNDEITPDSFAAWWDMVYAQIEDEANCPNPWFSLG